MNAKIAVLFAFVCAASGRVFLLDDFEGAEPFLRVGGTLLDTLPLPPLTIPSLSTTPPRPTDVSAPSTPSPRLTPRPTSSGESGTGPELSTEDRLINLS